MHAAMLLDPLGLAAERRRGRRRSQKERRRDNREETDIREVEMGGDWRKLPEHSLVLSLC